MKNVYAGIIVVAVIIGGVWYASSQPQEGDVMVEKTDDAMTQQKDAMEKATEDAMIKKDEGAMKDNTDGVMMTKGSYEAYAPEKLMRAKDGKVVLFFRASWCPTCRALDANIRANMSAVPAGVTILDVDYDKETALKQKYGVTYQHTLVQVMADGTQITKWSSSPTLAELISRIK